MNLALCLLVILSVREISSVSFVEIGSTTKGNKRFCSLDSEKFVWEQAHTSCIDAKLSLVSVDSEDEAKELVGILAKDPTNRKLYWTQGRLGARWADGTRVELKVISDYPFYNTTGSPGFCLAVGPDSTVLTPLDCLSTMYTLCQTEAAMCP